MVPLTPLYLVEFEFTRQRYGFATREEAEKFLALTAIARGTALESWEYVVRRVPAEAS